MDGFVHGTLKRFIEEMHFSYHQFKPKMKIFEIDLIRENIVKRLSNADASNLMEAMKPTKNWDFFHEDLRKKNRSAFCPICLLNHNAPLIDRSINHVLGIEWMSPINLTSYPHQYTIETKIYDEELDQIFERSPFILCTSENLNRHKNRLSLTPRSAFEDVKSYIDKIGLGEGLTEFKTEKDLINHIQEVRI